MLIKQIRPCLTFDVPSGGVGVVPVLEVLEVVVEVVAVAVGLLCIAVWCLGSPDQPSD